MLPRLLVPFASLVLVGLAGGAAQSSDKPKFRVKIADEKAIVTENDDIGAIDPTQRISFASGGTFYVNIRTLQGQTLHLSHFPQFLINNVPMQPGQGGRFEGVNAPLKKAATGKARNGYASTWIINDLRITQTVTLHPAKAKGAGQKRLMNTVLVAYTIENTAQRSQTIGARICMDTYVIDNDGCIFAAPTHPNKLLDGIVLKDKTLPAYVQMLQRPDLRNPGYISHLSLDMGSRYEKVTKCVLSSLRVGFTNWEMVPAQAMGDSAISFYWATKEMKPGSKRELAYAYGEGIAVAPESEGRFQMALGGSCEPGKTFTISAVVADPPPGQTLSLELPTGIQRLEAKTVQPVAPLAEDQESTTVLWKCRVSEPGVFPIRIRSSTGVTQTKIVTVTAER
ncbi:MAG: hypothetical protein FJ303_09875 [Planctomycetes bacterium]|nr:hypothetical protein [Planctomycetota bacterium]